MANRVLTFIGYDDWDRSVFEIELSSGLRIALVDVDGILHTINDPYGWAEPCTPTGIITPEGLSLFGETTPKEGYQFLGKEFPIERR